MFIVKCVNLEIGWVVYKMSYNGWVYKIVLMFYTPCYTQYGKLPKNLNILDTEQKLLKMWVG